MFESRRNQRESEWMLNPTILKDAIRKLDLQPEIDLFASRINAQFPKYASFRPDPHAFAIDAFTLQWTDLKLYAFPPFSVIASVLSKIQREKAVGICVLPNWPTQSWYAKAYNMMTQDPIRIKASKELLSLPSHPQEIASTHLHLIRQSLNRENLSESAIEIIMSSWRHGTAKQH